MARKVLGGALATIVIAIGFVALAIPYYWAIWIWSLDWGTFLMNRRWIFCFLGLMMGTPLLLLVIFAPTSALATSAWEWGKGTSAGEQ